MIKNGLKLTKNSQKCIKCTKNTSNICVNSAKCIYKNVTKTIDLWLDIWYNTSAWYALKREVAAKAGNFRGVCPLNGRKNSLKREEFCEFPEFVGFNPDHKVRFCKEKRKTPDTVFKGNAPSKLVRRRKSLHLLYIHARATIYGGAVVSVKRTKSIRRHKKWQ